jgi:hypothetical protein
MRSNGALASILPGSDAMIWRKSPDALVQAFDHCLPIAAGVQRKAMFGYPCAFMNGHLFCGLHLDSIIVRLPEGRRNALVARGASVFMPMPGQAMEGVRPRAGRYRHRPREASRAGERGAGARVVTGAKSEKAERGEEEGCDPDEEGNAREKELQEEALGLTIHAGADWYARCFDERSSTRSSRPQGATKMATKKTGGRKYGKGASAKVAKTMHERKEGTLRSGSSGKRVTSRKQAIAIGLSEARRAGKKVPKKKGSSKKG